MIYTPQMIIMGQDDVVGADALAVDKAIASGTIKQPRPGIAELSARSLTGIVVIRLEPKVPRWPEGPLSGSAGAVTLRSAKSALPGVNWPGKSLQLTPMWWRTGKIAANWDGAGSLEISVPCAGQ